MLDNIKISIISIIGGLIIFYTWKINISKDSIIIITGITIPLIAIYIYKKKKDVKE